MSSKPIVDHDDALFSNPDLLRLYLVPGALIASACIGYNSSVMNGIQGSSKILVSYYLAPVLRSIGITLINVIIQI
ncbi:Hexose transporter [Colletotrichum higginsianum IMI 349063]|uniref:Hexose transporter n=1 Tax=Colletotrichum higginsianum (strain IMI 349063) TaxID=759273 RepID=A0A1B7YDR5_COLHI|nr:Hexose transporter [Colletotrichum higginsianum IMI 349063]OBR09988.1 Hexose transporter [Colletotrichum higginsianum IMI 349063]